MKIAWNIFTVSKKVKSICHRNNQWKIWGNGEKGSKVRERVKLGPQIHFIRPCHILLEGSKRFDLVLSSLVTNTMRETESTVWIIEPIRLNSEARLCLIMRHMTMIFPGSVHKEDSVWRMTSYKAAWW